MKRFIIALLLLCTIPAHAANFDFGLNWLNSPYSSLVMNAPLTSTLPSGSTFTRASTQWYLTDSSVYQSVASGVPAFNSKGLWVEPATTNKVTGYSIIPGDTYGATLSSGTAAKGKVYEIVTHTSVDWEAVGTRLSGTANTVGAKYVISGTLTFTANDTGKEVIKAVGTMASALNTTAITGLTFSGYNQTTGNLVVGASYKIVARTTLDFTTCGAANNTVGTVFTATSAGTLGTGDSVDNLSVNCSIVDDTAALQAAGLYGVTGAKVYKLDNSFGALPLYIVIQGSVGNTNPHSWFINERGGTGIFGSSQGGPQTSLIAQTNYATIKWENKTPPNSTVASVIGANTGQILYFILPQLEELPYSTSITPSQGATATRAATVESQPTTSIPSNSPWSMSFEWTPTVTGSSTRYLWGSYTDADNAMQILYNGTTVTSRKRVGGTNHDATKTLSASAGTTYRISVRVNADKTTDLFIDGVKGTGSADTTAPVLSTTMQLGSDGNGANQIVGQIRNYKIWRSARPDSAL